jgi:hypothetical protein
MSETEIWGPCGHNWVDFACYAVGALDDEIEARAVEALADACGICWAELMDVIRVIALLDEGFAAKRQERACRNSWPPRERR